MNRREFLTEAGRLATLAIVAGQPGLISLGCQSAGYRRASGPKPDFLVPPDPRLPGVVLARDEDHAAALGAALEGIGGIRRFIQPGERVLLKPNAAWDRVPAQAVNTNPLVVGEMVRQCRLAGAAEVLVTDHGGPRPEEAFTRSGIAAAVAQNGGRVIYLEEDDFLEDDLGGRFIGAWPVLRHVFEVDRFINMPIAKHHGLVAGTASMKNFFGAIGGVRDVLHDQLDQAIVDLAAYFRPTLTVIDATRVLMRHGPGGGAFEDVAVRNAVICATDQVAGDSCAAGFLGAAGRDIRHIILAAQQGLGEIDYRRSGFLELGGI